MTYFKVAAYVSFFLYFLSFVLILSSVMVVVSKNLVYSVLFLVVSFLSASFLILLLDCDYIGFIFIIIYVGAISVLFLFSVMMLEYKSKKAAVYETKTGFAGSLILTFLGFLILLSVNKSDSKDIAMFFVPYLNWFDLIESTSDIEVVSGVLYSDFILHFLLTGFILLSALISVVFLTTSFKFKTVKSNFKKFSVENRKLFYNKNKWKKVLKQNLF